MRRTYDVPFGRAGLAGLLAALILVCLPGTSIAGGASESSTDLPAGTGLLQHGDGYGKAGGAPPVRAVQRTLRSLGWQPGPVDGLYGPRTQAAVTRYQAASGLTPDGIVGPGTRQALTNARSEPLRRGAGFAQPGGSPSVRELQTDLRRKGLSPGPVDGLYGPRTQAAVERLQLLNGIPVSGVATSNTRQVLATGSPAPSRERAAKEPRTDARQGDRPANAQPGPGRRDEPDRAGDTAPTDQPQPVPATANAGDDAEGVSVPVAIGIGIAALLAGLLGGALLGGRDRVVSGTAVPLAKGVMAEGESRSSSVGRFRGTVHALVLGRRGLRRTPEARYLVSDPAKHDPFWVSQEEVSNLVPPARGRDPAPSGTDLEPVRALGYVSTPLNAGVRSDEFVNQLNAIDAYCDEHGWELVEVVQDVDTTRARERQGLLYALDKIGRGEASCIIVSELGRLSRSAADLGGILDRLQRSQGRLVALDVGLDTASEEGRVAAQALTSVGSWEHERSTGRLAASSAGLSALVEPRTVEDVGALKQRIVEMREIGMTLQAIADVLNAEGVPTLRGGAKWRPSSVQSAAGYRRPPRQRE